MSSIDAPGLLRAELLEGVSIVLARAPAAGREASPCEEVEAGCTALGARVSVIELALADDAAEDRPAEGQPDGGALERAVEQAGALDCLVVDAASVFAAGASPRAALGDCLQASWRVTHAAVNRCYLANARGGRIVYVAPACGPTGASGADSGPDHADAARAGLENLSRTLSIEWARHAITAVTIAPASTTAPGELAALSAYLASPAGSYFSGCLLDLRGVRAGPASP